MYCLNNICYVCLETKNNLISSVDSLLPVIKELLAIFDYCAHNLPWLKTKRIILICEECCSRLRETYQFLKLLHKNSAVLQGYMDQLNSTAPSNTETEAELLVHLVDIIAVKCEIKKEPVHTDEYEPIIEEAQDVFVNAEDSLTIEEGTWKKEETDDREEYPMDNNSTHSKNNESDTDISINSNTILNTENEAEPLIQLKDNNQVNCEIKDEEISADEYQPIIEEPQDVFVNTEDTLTIVEDMWKKEETDDKEEYPMDNNSTESMNNESNSDISVNSNTHITDTDRVGKQAPATNKTNSTTPANKPHTCATCSKSFTRKADLQIHTRFHTGERPYKCDRCEKCFVNNSHLVRHMRIHTGEKPYKCDMCAKCFNIKSNFVIHMRTHTGEKPYQCAKCKKYFSQHSSLVSHMRLHTGEKPYKCDRCDKFFSQNIHLVSHMRTHTGEKPYKCDRCDKFFRSKAYLVVHIRTHTGEKPYECAKCRTYFSRRSNLMSHMRLHTGEKPYKCERCEKCFARKSHLVYHMRTHTGGTFQYRLVDIVETDNKSKDLI